MTSRLSKSDLDYFGDLTLDVSLSLLQETGPLDFRQPGKLSDTRFNVVKFLADKHKLPDLSGMTVVRIGIGDTAPPQRELYIGSRRTGSPSGRRSPRPAEPRRP